MADPVRVRYLGVCGGVLNRMGTVIEVFTSDSGQIRIFVQWDDGYSSNGHGSLHMSGERLSELGIIWEVVCPSG